MYFDCTGHLFFCRGNLISRILQLGGETSVPLGVVNAIVRTGNLSQVI